MVLWGCDVEAQALDFRRGYGRTELAHLNNAWIFFGLQMTKIHKFTCHFEYNASFKYGWQSRMIIPNQYLFTSPSFWGSNFIYQLPPLLHTHFRERDESIYNVLCARVYYIYSKSKFSILSTTTVKIYYASFLN